MSRRWWIAALLFLSTLLNYFDRQIFSLVSPVLRNDFAMSAQEYSHLLTAFLLGYTLIQLFAGLAIYRLGPGRGMVVAMAWWSLAGACMALARQRWQLGLFLLLMGVGEAANWPTSVKAVREWFAPEQRAIAVGIFNAGSSAGAIIAPVLVSRLALQHSWRTPFLLCGIAGLAWVVLWRAVYRVPPTLTDPNLGPVLSRVSFARDRRAWGIVLGRLFADPIWLFYVFWLPDYLAHVQGFSLRQIGQTAWIPFSAAAVGNFFGGSCSGWLVRRGVPVVRARFTVMAGSAFVMSLGFIVRFCTGATSALAVISLVVFAYSCWAANVLTLPGDVFPSRMVASVTGASGTAGGLGGMLITLFTGYMVDRSSYGGVFAVLACLPILALLCASLSLKHSADQKSIQR